MTREEENRLWVDHMRRGEEFSIDPWAQLAALYRHAERNGRTFNFFRNHGAI